MRRRERETERISKISIFFYSDGGKVDLSGTTVSFCKATHSFVQEGLRLYIPEVRDDGSPFNFPRRSFFFFFQLYGVFIESTSSLFQEQLIIIQDALAEDQYLQEVIYLYILNFPY